MPRATGRKTSIARYEDTWETINRLIRRGGSWSGFERNCFFVQSEAGEFLNVSAVSGLDVPEDGRGLAVWDFDLDGDPDLLLKSRSSPQVRLWRNDLAAASARVSVVLRGARPNVQAVGARVTVAASARRQAQEVRAGSGFLSQSTTRLLFGLGEAGSVDELRVRWPSGETQVFTGLPVNREYAIDEGARAAAPVGRPFATGSAGVSPAPDDGRLPDAPEGGDVVEATGSAGAPPASGDGRRPSAAEARDVVEATGSAGAPPAPASDESRSLWLLAPLPLPPISLFDADGRAVPLDTFHGRPLLLNLWSDTCARCVAELSQWQRDRGTGETVTSASPFALLAVASGERGADGRGTREARRAAELAGRFGVGAAFAAPEARLTLAILLEEIARWPREFGLPASLLVEGEGRIVKIYRGPVAWKTIARDVGAIPRTIAARQRLALPFPGEYYATSRERSYFQLGINLAEAGVGYARWAFERALEEDPREVDALYNLGVIHQAEGDADAAARLYRKTLESRRDFVDAWVNLGVLQARAKRYLEARASFSEALRRRENHVEARVNLANVELALGRPGAALREYDRALDLDPGLVGVHRSLGALYRRLGDLENAAEAYDEITRIDPGDAEAWSNLGVIHAESGDLRAALAACRRAVALDPDSASAHNNLGLLYQGSGDLEKAVEHFRRAVDLGARPTAPYLNLARAYLRQGRVEEARRVLERRLEEQPGDPGALELLKAMSPGGAQDAGRK